MTLTLGLLSLLLDERLSRLVTHTIQHTTRRAAARRRFSSLPRKSSRVQIM